MRVTLREVVGVDWFEFGADFAAGCFFVVLGMAPAPVFLVTFLSFSTWVVAKFGNLSSSVSVSSLETSSSCDWSAEPPLGSCGLVVFT